MVQVRIYSMKGCLLSAFHFVPVEVQFYVVNVIKDFIIGSVVCLFHCYRSLSPDTWLTPRRRIGVSSRVSGLKVTVCINTVVILYTVNNLN